MATMVTFNDISVDRDVLWELVEVVSVGARESIQEQIDLGLNQADSDPYGVLKGLVEDKERATAEGLAPGMTLGVELAARGSRVETNLKSFEPLSRASFDWLTDDVDRFIFTIHHPEGWTFKFDVWTSGSVTVTVENSFVARGLATRHDFLDQIEAVLERHVIPAAPTLPFRIVMGHGNDHQWRILRDELRDHHDFDVSAFEGRPRAGQTINTVLEDMAAEASVALIVLTRADEMKDGKWRARQNVVHEVGFFQGRLGWTNAIVVVEDGVDLFSNLDGTQQIRFPEGNIAAATGNVAATLRAKERSGMAPSS